MPRPAWASGSSGTGLGLLLPALLLLLDFLGLALPPECCRVAIVAEKAEGEAEEAAVAAPVLSAALLAAGEVTVPAAAATAANAAGALLLLLLPLSPAAALAPVLLPVIGFLLPVLGSLLTRVAAVALNSVDLGAGSLNAPGLTAVRCCCFISLQALSLARMSPVPACCCAETVPVRSALNTPGLSPAAADLLLMAADMLRPRGVCMTCCL